MKKDKDTKQKKGKKEKVIQQGREMILKIRKEARIDTLQGLRQMAENGLVLDVTAFDEMIAEVEAANTPVQEMGFRRLSADLAKEISGQ